MFPTKGAVGLSTVVNGTARQPGYSDLSQHILSLEEGLAEADTVFFKLIVEFREQVGPKPWPESLSDC